MIPTDAPRAGPPTAATPATAQPVIAVRAAPRPDEVRRHAGTRGESDDRGPVRSSGHWFAAAALLSAVLPTERRARSRRRRYPGAALLLLPTLPSRFPPPTIIRS